jgi:hypothetical protein
VSTLGRTSNVREQHQQRISNFVVTVLTVTVGKTGGEAK